MGIIAGGCAIAFVILRPQPQPETLDKPIPVEIPVAEVMAVEPGHHQVFIAAIGTVIPAREVKIFPQVSGHIVKTAPGLMPGGRFRTGDMLFQVDDRDYRIAMEQQKARVAQALVDLQMEKGRQMVAKQEWDLLGDSVNATDEGRDLALRKPHLAGAEAALAGAQSALEKAGLDLERTTIRAAFNGFIKEKFSDLGQHVTPGTPLVTLVGTDTFWIKVPVPADRLPDISIPGRNGALQGSAAAVIQENPEAGPRVVRQGRVAKLMGDMDPEGRMARVLVSVEDPLDLESSDVNARQIPLLLDNSVRVEIQGPILEWVFSIPPSTLREGNTVWIVAPENRLVIKEVSVVWRAKDHILIRGLDAGDWLILNPIPQPVSGMALKVQQGLNIPNPAILKPIVK
jgi:RND family efflux transporter MFP subunit